MTSNLIACGDCGTSISVRAASCPRCGAPGPGAQLALGSLPTGGAGRGVPVPGGSGRLSASIVAGATAAVVLAFGFLVFAFFVVDVYFGFRGAGNLRDLAGIALMTFVPIGGAVRAWLGIRAKNPPGSGTRSKLLPSLLLLGVAYVAGLYFLWLGYENAFEYLVDRDRAGTVMAVAVTTVLFLFGPIWMSWATWTRTRGRMRLAVAIGMAIVCYASFNFYWGALTHAGVDSGASTQGLALLFPVFAIVAALWLHLPRWVFVRLRRRLTSIEATS